MNPLRVVHPKHIAGQIQRLWQKRGRHYHDTQHDTGESPAKRHSDERSTPPADRFTRHGLPARACLSLDGSDGALPWFALQHQVPPSAQTHHDRARVARPSQRGREASEAMLSPTEYRTPLALAGLQIVLGYAWLVAGVDKLLLARFPSMLASLLTSTIHGGMIPAPFVSVLQLVVIPHAVVFGVLTEWGEQLTGLGLIAAGLTALLASPAQHKLPQGDARLFALFQRLMRAVWPIAALGGVVMGFTFYLVDGAPNQGFMPSTAFGGALDEGFLLALGSAVLLMVAVTSRIHHIAVSSRSNGAALARGAPAADHRRPTRGAARQRV